MDPNEFEKSVKLAVKAGYKKKKDKNAHYGIVCKNEKGKIWIHDIIWLRRYFRKKENLIDELNSIGLKLGEIRDIFSNKKEIPDQLLEKHNYDVENWNAREEERIREREKMMEELYKLIDEDE